MRVVVTGGLGFIGSHVVEELDAKGYDVVIIDNLSLGKMENMKKMRLKNRVELIVSRSGEIDKVEGDVDAIIHLGIPSSSPMYRADRSLVMVAVEDMLKILEYAIRNKCRVVLASTSSIYNGNPIPWHEYMPVHVTDWYTEVRYFLERLCKLYARRYLLECVALRLFSVYGMREEHKGSYANIVSQMIWAGLKGEEFIIWGDGSQSRDFIYVKDVARAFVKALDMEMPNPFEPFEVINVGTGKRYSFNQVAEMIRRNGLDLKLKYVDKRPPFYIEHTLADTIKMNGILRFEPAYRLEEMIPHLISYYRQVIGKKEE